MHVDASKAPQNQAKTYCTLRPIPPCRRSLPGPSSDKTAEACADPPSLRPAAFPTSSTLPQHPATPTLPWHQPIGPSFERHVRSFTGQGGPVSREEIGLGEGGEGAGFGSSQGGGAHSIRAAVSFLWRLAYPSRCGSRLGPSTTLKVLLKIFFTRMMRERSSSDIIVRMYMQYLVGLFQPHGDLPVLGFTDFFRSPQALDHPLPLPPELVLHTPIQYLFSAYKRIVDKKKSHQAQIITYYRSICFFFSPLSVTCVSC